MDIMTPAGEVCNTEQGQRNLRVSSRGPRGALLFNEALG